MHGKRRTLTTVVTESSAHAKLRRGPARALAPEEERVVRMRLGARVPLSARLQRIATATDVEIELLAYEIEAYLKLKERRGAKAVAAARPMPAAAAHAPAPTASRTKEKIVRALRKKA